VVANQTLEVNITLLPESNQLQEVILTANVARNSESSLIKAQRQSVNVMNGISAEGLQKNRCRKFSNRRKKYSWGFGSR
jgi:hypothetical protein